MRGEEDGSVSTGGTGGDARRALASMSQAARIRAVLGAIARFVVTFGLVTTVYFVLPWSPVGSGVRTVFAVVGAAVLLAVVVLWQIRQILRSRTPGLRAVLAVGIALPLFLGIFATAYALMSQRDPGSFTEPLDRVSALYFSVVVFGTVGFGDIAPLSGLSRMLVSAQILLNLAFLALVVRAFFAASRVSSLRGGPRRAVDMEDR